MNNTVNFPRIIHKMLITTGMFVGLGILVGVIAQSCSTPLKSLATTTETPATLFQPSL
ncbi:hypothetical protein [Candidatus Sororendozoicomonas aggregata]|uniref:hypothetical protein n=1 Tax=Candidatus Sororendozoicomonas aggregata TaxID=3073239 RepID=UPI002ED0614D